ncbi:MAG: hypothetical protein V1662_00500 [Candidatus Omnitrophota bacterium]
MSKKINILVLVTSAPHFPLPTARDSYHQCLKVLRDNFSRECDFGELPQVITGTVGYEEELAKLKSRNPEILLLVQGGFTWDNITVYLHSYFGKLPLIQWALPERNYHQGQLGANSLCGMIMNNSALHKLGTAGLSCYGSPDEQETILQLAGILRTAICSVKIKRAKYGMAGYRPTGFYGSTFDEMKIRRELGIETIYYDLSALFDDLERIPAQKIAEDVKAVKRLGKIGEADQESLVKGSRIYLVLRDFIQRERIDFLTVRCWPEMMKKGLNPCLVLGRLLDEGVPAGCEADFGGALSLAIAAWISAGGSWLADIIDVNKGNSSFYLWHCGAAPCSLAGGKESPVINKQFRSVNCCNTLEFALQEGDVTVIRFGTTNDRYRIFAFEGKAVLPRVKIRGNISEIIPRQKVQCVLDKIRENGVEQHFAVAYGHYAEQLKNLAAVLKVDFYSV